MRDESWKKKWQEAFSRAGFYRSDRNMPAYWNEAARTDGGGLSATEHVRLITDYMFDNGLLDARSTVLDMGCGGGDYTVGFAERCGHVTAMDYAADMLELCRRRCAGSGLDNVSFIHGDILRYDFREKYDCVMACLNPSAYQPAALDRMLSLAAGYVIYFSMDIPIGEKETEPVYCGCNSVRYAEAYLKEQGIDGVRIPYAYSHKTEDGSIREVPFAYLVIPGKGA